MQQYYPIVKTLGDKTHVFPQVVFSQAFIEGTDNKGNFGGHENFRNANNIFNIRPGKGWKGAVYLQKNNPESPEFRKYDSLEDSIKDYFSFLVNNKRYRDAGVFKADTWQEQAEAIDRAGYAGNSGGSYSALIKKVGATVTTALKKMGAVIVEHKQAVTAGAGILLASLAAGFLILGRGRK